MTLQGIIDASVTGSGANRVGDRIDLCKETIGLHDTRDVASSVHGMHVRGRGGATRFRWRGEYSPPMFRLTDGNGCGLSDFTVELARPAKTLVHILDSGSGPVRSSHNTLRNIHVPDAGDRLETFWRIGGEAVSTRRTTSCADTTSTSPAAKPRSWSRAATR
jgi:hypothetical protein